MNKEKQILVPEVRFPEFENDVEWVENIFDSLIEIIDGDRGVKYPKQNDFSDVGYCLFLNAKNVTKEGFVFDQVKFVTKEKDESLRKGKLQRFDIVLTTRGSVGQFAYYSNDVHFDHLRLNSGMVILRIKDNILLSDFFYKYCYSNVITSEIKNLEFGNAQKQLTVAIIKKLPLVYPKNKKEQQKIANCLSSLDTLITSETEKLDHLKDHKKGLLQQLFPANGETKPQFRFPEFKNDGDWVSASLGSLVEIKGRIGYRGYTRKDIVEKGKGAVTLSPSNFGKNGKLNFEKCTYITWEKYDESPEIMLEEGQTVLVKTASVGKSAYVDNLIEKTTVNPQIVVLKPQKIEPKFLAYTIFHNYVQNQIKESIGAGAIPNMSQASIANFKILLPPRKDGKEQQKIANCLSSADDLIEAQVLKIKTLKKHKKGLMQQLFPNVNELAV